MAIGDVKLKITRSDGKTFNIGANEWRIPNDGLTNWANLPYNVSSVEIPSADGSIVTSKRVGAVDRTVKAVSAEIEQNSKLRMAAISFFNPKYTFKVHITYMGHTRWCEGEQIGFKVSEGNIYEPVELTWTVLCSNPYMKSVEDYGKDIAEVVPSFGFPFYSALPESTASVNYGFITGAHMFAKTVDIENDGDVPSGMNVTITATGDVVNPSVTVGDGTIRVICNLRQGDILKLNAETRPPQLTLNGVNVMQKLDRASNILDMAINPGGTTIGYDAESGEQFMNVTVRYNRQYLGV